MPSGYFERVARETGTRLWINNPMGLHLAPSIAAGAINCTTNPQYCSKLIDGDPEYIEAIIDRVIAQVEDDDEAAEQVYGMAATRVMEAFLPLYEASGKTEGFVTVQGDPRRDDDPDYIVNEALRFRQYGQNFMTKIPVTEAGTEAIASLVARNIPICATEIFGLAQAIYICEAYQRAAAKTGNHPPFFVTHISGIFDEYIGKYVKQKGIEVSSEALFHAGCAVARKQYRLLKQRGYPGIMLGGGARGNHHFTELVGGDMHVTINWSTVQELSDANGPVVNRMDAEVPPELIDELCDKLVDFRRAWYEDGLEPAEFKDFGPLLLFRGNFVAGWQHLLRQIAARRVQAAAKA